jgi:hypothetical protein
MRTSHPSAHLSLDQIEWFLSKESAEAEKIAFTAHLSLCEECCKLMRLAQEYEEIQRDALKEED